MGLIYMLTFPSGKSYVGQTVTSFKDRFSKHISSANCNKGGCHLLNHAINKYGYKSIKHEILVECNDELLNHYEVKFIECYRTLVPHGYNLQKGGVCERNTPAYRQTLSEIQKQKYKDDEKVREHIKQNGHNTKIHKELPDYMTVEKDYEKDEIIGYRIYRHPMCPRMKKFCSLKLSLDELYTQAFEYLKYLNTLKKPIEYVEKPVIGRKREGDQTLPKYVIEIKRHKVVVGYDVKVPNTLRKSFSSSSMSLAENRKHAIEYLNSLKLDKTVQRLDGNGSDGASTSQA